MSEKVFLFIFCLFVCLFVCVFFNPNSGTSGDYRPWLVKENFLFGVTIATVEELVNVTSFPASLICTNAVQKIKWGQGWGGG